MRNENQMADVLICVAIKRGGGFVQDQKLAPSDKKITIIDRLIIFWRWFLAIMMMMMMPTSEPPLQGKRVVVDQSSSCCRPPSALLPGAYQVLNSWVHIWSVPKKVSKKWVPKKWKLLMAFFAIKRRTLWQSRNDSTEKKVKNPELFQVPTHSRNSSNTLTFLVQLL